MSHAAQGAILAAALLAMVSAGFGVAFARLVWAQDLKQAQQLRLIWDKTEKAMREHIEIQERMLASHPTPSPTAGESR